MLKLLFRLLNPKRENLKLSPKGLHCRAPGNLRGSPTPKPAVVIAAQQSACSLQRAVWRRHGKAADFTLECIEGEESEPRKQDSDGREMKPERSENKMPLTRLEFFRVVLCRHLAQISFLSAQVRKGLCKFPACAGGIRCTGQAPEPV